VKVLHVETGRNLYGGALQVVHLINGLKNRGVSNILVCTAGSPMEQGARGADRVYPLPMAGDLDIRFIWRLRRIIKRERPDILHLHSRRGADTLGGVAAKLSRAKSVLSRRVDNPEHPLVARLKYALYDRVITISEGIGEVLIKEGVPGGKIDCVHSAVDAGLYTGKCDGEWFRKEFGMPSRFRTVGMVAQFIERKGHRYLLSAVPDVLNSMPQVKFVFFGKGPLEEKLRGLCRSLNIDDSVRFAGFREDLERVLPCLDVLVHPAEMEGLGVSLLQAAASGVPVVATRVGGIPEIVRDGVNGLLIPPRNPEAISEAVIKLLGDPERARAMGAEGRRIVREEFSIEAMVEGNLKVYEKLLG
jgi:glycosyltransferase involved in cell wall biosynthesis